MVDISATTTDATTSTAPRRGRYSWVGTVPYFGFVAMFLVWPTAIVGWHSIHNKSGVTFSYLHSAFTGQFLRAFRTSAMLSATTAIAGGIIGTMAAYAIVTIERPRFLKSAVTTFSGVASQMGGVPLAFAFVAALGTQGMITTFLRDRLSIDLNQHGFNLFTFRGLQIVYLYFQVPLMILVMLPAVEGLRPAWSEAAANLGASRFQYWRLVGLPVLGPAMLGGMVLLFANAFSAYATAAALTSGFVNLVPLKIGDFVSGNVLDDVQLGNALAFGMIVVIAFAIGGYQALQRRSAKWLR